MTTLSKEDVKGIAESLGWSLDEIEIDDMVDFATLARADLVAENEQLRVIIDEEAKDSAYVIIERDKLLAENERLKSDLSKYRAIRQYKEARRAEVAVLRDQLTAARTALAAAEAREANLRDALDNHSGNYKLSKDECAKVNALLDAPRDDSALREMIAGVYEECAKACRKEAVVIVVDGKEERAYNNAISDCELAIRALAEKAKGQ